MLKLQRQEQIEIFRRLRTSWHDTLFSHQQFFDTQESSKTWKELNSRQVFFHFFSPSFHFFFTPPFAFTSHDLSSSCRHCRLDNSTIRPFRYRSHINYSFDSNSACLFRFNYSTWSSNNTTLTSTMIFHLFRIRSTPLVSHSLIYCLSAPWYHRRCDKSISWIFHQSLALCVVEIASHLMNIDAHARPAQPVQNVSFESFHCGFVEWWSWKFKLNTRCLSIHEQFSVFCCRFPGINCKLLFDISWCMASLMVCWRWVWLLFCAELIVTML